MKNILFICQSLGNGGAERVVSVLVNSFDKAEYNIFVLPLRSDKISYQIDDKVQILKAYQCSSSGIKRKLEYIKEIRHVIRKFNINDVVAFSHYNTMYSVIAAFGLDVKIIGSERNDPAQLKNKRFTNFLRNILYSRLDYLVCQTNDAKNYFPKNIQKKCVIILNPLINNLPKPYDGVREKRIVTFCRLEKQKNIPLLLSAFKNVHIKYSDYQLDIYGEGTEYDHIRDIIDKYNLTNYVNLYPFDKNIHNKVINAAMFVLSSDYEGLSNSMLEAMAIGLPTIVTDCPCGGARMVIDNNLNGLLCSVGNESDLTNQIIRIIENKELAKKLGMNAVKIRERLSADNIAKQWQLLFKE